MIRGLFKVWDGSLYQNVGREVLYVDSDAAFRIFRGGMNMNLIRMFLEDLEAARPWRIHLNLMLC